MEGKGCLFKKFADIDVFDIELNARTRTVDRRVHPRADLRRDRPRGHQGAGVLRLRGATHKMQIPVFHDDQHGTAIISGAALLNALELTARTSAKIRVVVNGAGASAMACADFYLTLGVKENLLMVDTKGVVYEGRSEGMNSYKERFAAPPRSCARSRRQWWVQTSCWAAAPRGW